MFNAAASQQQATFARERMRGKLYQHFKGGVYEVLDVAVDEEHGHCVVIYRSVDHGYVWVRSLGAFEELVDGKLRFAQLG